MRRDRILFLIALLGLATLALAQQPSSQPPSADETRTPPANERPAPADDSGPLLEEGLSDQAVWSEDATSNEADEGFIPSEAISADAAIAFPVDI